MKKSKVSTYILTASKKFPADHISKGEPTNFRDKILNGTKIHTIRGNYDYWNRIVNRVNSGTAILEVRQWSGKPYNSKQEHVVTFTKLGIQRVSVYTNAEKVLVGDQFISPEQILQMSENDGLTFNNFSDWFRNGIDGCILHFTDFRY